METTEKAKGTSSSASNFRCLILEDDKGCAELVSALIEREGGKPQTSETVQIARATIETENFDLYIIDQMLPDGTGTSFFQHLRNRGVESAAIMLTGRPNLSTAVQLTRDGLFDYLAKPLDIPEFRQSVQRALAQRNTTGTEDYIGNAPQTREVRHLIQLAAANPHATVLLTGETGVGKDRAARAIHQQTFREEAAAKPLVAVNCAALPSDMFESELFGAERGAFTGAHQRRAGLVESVKGGTLFLDEISEVTTLAQSKLLHLLESGEYRRLGSTEVHRFSGRLIAASNRSLQAEADAGRFRSDLLYRLDVFPIHIAPLRERPDDIVPLANAILRNLSGKYQRTCPLLRPEHLAGLMTYQFPGNVRELRNILERALVQTPLETRWLNLLPSSLRRQPSLRSSPGAPTPGTHEPLSTLKAQEYQSILAALLEEKGRIRGAARRLGLTHQSLLRRLKKWPQLRSAVPGHRADETDHDPELEEKSALGNSLP